jgi:hypothetical protein
MDTYIDEKKPVTGLDRSQYIRELIIADLKQLKLLKI